MDLTLVLVLTPQSDIWNAYCLSFWSFPLTLGRMTFLRKGTCVQVFPGFCTFETYTKALILWQIVWTCCSTAVLLCMCCFWEFWCQSNYVILLFHLFGLRTMWLLSINSNRFTRICLDIDDSQSVFKWLGFGSFSKFFIWEIRRVELPANWVEL